MIDYTRASRLFDEWDKPGEPPEGGPKTTPPLECTIGGKVIDAETTKPIAGAHVVLQTGPNDIIDQHTGPDGQFSFTAIGEGQVLLVVTASRYHRIQTTYETRKDAPLALEIYVRSESQAPTSKKIRITKLDVRFVDETYEERDAEGNLVSPEDYLRKVRQEILTACHSMVELQGAWIERDRREQLLQLLEERMVHIDILREILQRPDADAFDLLAHAAFDAEIHSCEERAAALFNLHKEFFDKFDAPAREVLLALVEKYRFGGLSGVTDPLIFQLAPFNSDVRTVAQSFGGIADLRRTVDDLVRLIYQQEAA